MKKLLLIAAATAALSTSVMADEGSANAPDNSNAMYLRVDGGTDIFMKSSYAGVKLKPKATEVFDIGIGAMMGEGLRGEAVFAHHFKQNVNGSTVTATQNTSVRVKSSINSFMARGYYDIYDAGSMQLFVGAGVGVAYINEKVNKEVATTTKASSARSSGISARTVTINGVLQTPAMLAALNSDTNVYQKEISSVKHKKTNFAYSLAAGAAFKANDTLTFDLQYNFSDFGKATAVKHRGHTVTGGIRFAI